MPLSLRSCDEISNWRASRRRRASSSGIDETNAGDLVRETGVREIHFSVRREVVVAPSGGEEGVRMGSDASADRVLGVTDVDRVRSIVAAVR
jgi:copper homeostasis protein CutC